LEVYVVGRNQLVLKGERKPESPEKSICHRQERGLTSFTRSLTLPADVDPDQVEAKLEHGVLTVKLAKSATARPKKITVRGD
jgi:HSP20 family protein